jgi:hypothetical protein
VWQTRGKMTRFDKLIRNGSFVALCVENFYQKRGFRTLDFAMWEESSLFT